MMDLGSLESVVPYLPLFIVIGWGLYRMFTKMGRRLYYRRRRNEYFRNKPAKSGDDQDSRNSSKSRN